MQAMKSLITIFLYLTFYTPVYLYAQNDTILAGRQIDSIFNQYQHTAGPGCAVAVIRHGQVILEKAYGMANLEYRQPITANSAFDIGSLTKQFTGLAISTLAQEGKLSPQDDIRKYLPWVPVFGKPITIDNLLRHTSGLRDYPEALMAAGWRYHELATMADVKELVSKQKELDFTPGTEESYCNTGYVLLAMIVEKASGESFPEWLKQQVFIPLHMDSSFILADAGRVIPDLATSYAKDGQGYSRYTDMLTAYGSSAMYSTLNDLSKWVIHFQEMLRQKDPVYARMIQTGRLTDGAAINYGYGLETGDERGLAVIAHTGAWVGYRTDIRIYPHEDFAFVTLSNADDNDLSGTYARAIAATWLKKRFSITELDSVKAWPAKQLNPGLLKKYEGDWLLGPPANKIFSFHADSGHLIITIGNASFPLEAKSDHDFYFAADQSLIKFKLPSNLVYQSATIMIQGQQVEKIKKRILPPVTVYCGTYHSNELETSYTVYTFNGKLMVHHFRLGDFQLTPSGLPGEFTSDIGRFDFYKGKMTPSAGFYLSGERVRKLRFERQPNK